MVNNIKSTHVIYKNEQNIVTKFSMLIGLVG